MGHINRKNIRMSLLIQLHLPTYASTLRISNNEKEVQQIKWLNRLVPTKDYNRRIDHLR